MSLHGEAINNALRHYTPSFPPRGELFFARRFLDHFFPDPSGDYIGQVERAARLLGLSVVGVDLNGEPSRSLPGERNYERLMKYFTVGYINGPVLQAIAKLGFRQAMVCIKKDRRAFLESTWIHIKDIEEKSRLARDNGLCAIALADDIAGNRGLLFSYEDFTATILPLYKQIADVIKANGLFAFFHSDGDTTKIIEPLINAGYDCIHPVDAQAGLNLYKLNNIFRDRVVLMGHIDIITWPEERISREVNQAKNIFRDGGLILGSTCGLSLETISDRLNALYPQWKRIKKC